MSEELIKRILIGIDKTQSESEEGWWETSDGASFGAGKLKELLFAITRQTGPVADQVNTDTVSVPTVPTDAMRDAGNEIIKNRSQLFQAWNAMLRAAQEGKK